MSCKKIIQGILLLLAVTFSQALEDGIYKGVSEGYEGEITLDVKVDQGRVVDIKVLSQSESKPQSVFEEVTTNIILSQNWEVDAVSGATATSFGVMLAVKEAMIKAGLNQQQVIPVTEKRIVPEYEDKHQGEVVKLPPPSENIQVTLFEALKKRSSTRSFSNKMLPLQEMSDLLWSACGFNRRDELKRTVPSARNWQEIDVYVATRRGVYVYDALNHELKKTLSLDIRKYTGVQNYTIEAPVNLIYVCNTERMEGANEPAKNFFGAVDTGYISQNVYLYCAARDLATTAVGWVKKRKLANILRLKRSQKVIICQMVGYPAE